ncbi:MAG: Ycf66 family protein [Elainellaceae cyanobacterium]
MINIGGGPAFILGVAMILAGVALYALRSMRPELSRDHDIFFAAIALTSGAILMWQGWRLDPFLFLGYLCSAGSAAFFGVENIRLRGITTEQAKRTTPITDKGRSVSRRYDYEPQDYDYDQDYGYRPGRGLPSREDRAGRRIRSTRDSARPAYEDERQGDERYGDERPRLRRREAAYDDRYADARYDDNRYPPLDETPPLESSPRKRRLPRPSRSERPAARDSWDVSGDVVIDRPAPPRPLGDSPPPKGGTSEVRQRRPLNVKPAPADYGATYRDEPPAPSADYADYRPIDDDYAEGEDDNRDYQQPY